jgi:carbon monoxide dehydrogenase subunit G
VRVGRRPGGRWHTRPMTEFTVHNRSSARVQAPRPEIWAALTDPELLPRLTPYLHAIEVDGDRWRWHLTRIPVLGVAIAPSFTEVMDFDAPSSITFEHDPARPDERAGASGRYHLKEARAGTDLAIDLAISVDLPFPSVARPAVQTAMKGVVGAMGSRFSANLVRHLDS